MTQLSTIEKFAIVTILSQIMKADGIIHPKEEEYMDMVFAELGITISDMEDMANMDDIQAKCVINEMVDDKNGMPSLYSFQWQSLMDIYIQRKQS